MAGEKLPDREKTKKIFLGMVPYLKKEKGKVAECAKVFKVMCLYFTDLDLKMYMTLTEEGDVDMLTEAPEKVDATITWTVDAFHDIALGKISPLIAFGQGKIKVDAPVPKLMKFMPLLPALTGSYKELLAA